MYLVLTSIQVWDQPKNCQLLPRVMYSYFLTEAEQLKVPGKQAGLYKIDR